MISRGWPDQEDDLKLVVLHNLARLHSSTDTEYKELYQLPTEEYLDHQAYNWYADPSSVGAFTFFGPGHFRNMRPSVVQSNGKHIIIGEAASSHHGWVVGALESDVRGVCQFFADTPTLARPLPAEYDRPQDARVPGSAENTTVPSPPSPRGELARHQVMIEEIRLKQGGDVVDPSRASKEDVAPFCWLSTPRLRSGSVDRSVSYSKGANQPGVLWCIFSNIYLQYQQKQCMSTSSNYGAISSECSRPCCLFVTCRAWVKVPFAT